MMYPANFARDLLAYLAAQGWGVKVVDVAGGWIEYAATDGGTQGAGVVLISDEMLTSRFDKLADEAHSFFPSLPVPEAVMKLLAVYIDEGLNTADERPGYRFPITDFL